jgi:superfamily II DNA or RNA helicase
MYQDRPYQTACGEANLADYDNGVRRMMNVMATGTGKTYCFGQIPRLFKSRLPGQMLVLAHTDELVHQNADKMLEYNPHLKVSVEMGDEHADANSDVISGSVQTLGRAGTKRLERFNLAQLDKLIVDEAHHSTTDGYRRVLDWSGCLREGTDKLLVGVTATPTRTDGIALSDTFEKVSYVYTLRQAIEAGYLVRIRGYRVTTDTKLEDVDLSSISPVSRIVNTDQRNRRVVDAWRKLGEGRKTVVYTVDVEHAQSVAKEFKDNGIDADAVWGEDPDRETKLVRHRQSEHGVVVVCGLLVEGYDDPSISCVVLARPTASPVFLAQAVGRGTRLYPGKTDCVVIDIVDATKSASLVTLPTLMGLSPKLDVCGHDILEAAKILEEAAAKHPNINFTKLELLDKVSELIEQVDLMEIRFPEEVEAHSDLTWFRAVDGGFKMQVPTEGHGSGYVRIQENLLGQWDLKGEINEEEFHGTRKTLEETFKVADEQIRKRVNKQTIQYILREATWHNKPVTKGQIGMLKRLFPWKQFPLDQMTAGQASRIISEKLARKAK